MVATGKPGRRAPCRLVDDGKDLVVRLEGPDQGVLGTRRFSRTYSCQELVAAVSVTIAGWQSDVHPSFAPDLALPPVVPAQDLSAPPAAPPVETATVVARPAPAPPRWELTSGFAVGIGAALEGPAAVGEATIGMWLTPPAFRTSLRLELEGQTQRQLVLPGGSASWRRVSGGLGLERPLFSAGGSDARTALRWFALARVGWLGLQGQGFAVNHADNALDVGGSVGVRKPFLRGRWSFWGELVLSAWPIRHDVVGAGAFDKARLPLAEAFVRIGAGGSVFP